jgi:aspartate carbamoyltransferase catalytic subunit
LKSNRFFNRDVVSIKDFRRDELEFLFEKTDKMKKLNPKEKDELGKARIMGYLFYEPSTRTRMSFEAAMASIGGSSIGISDLKSSSIEKGESLQDTVHVMDLYSDLIILRHQLDGSSKFAAEISEHPIINGGSGSEEHPTQAMLDLYTILKEKKKIDGLKIIILGDLKYGRTIYSLLYGLANYDVEIILVSPPTLQIRQESIYGLKNKMKIVELVEMDETVIKNSDILYVTRIQKERFSDPQEYEKVKGTYTIDSNMLKKFKPGISILHPLPRMDEISRDLDNTNNAVYFKQASYGKDLRSALLALILNESPL